MLNILNPYPLVFCPAICYNIGMILKCPEVSGLKRVICILSTLCICMMLLPARLNAAEICQQSRFSSTFLQNWLCRDWTEERWIHEFSDAKAAGFDSLIIQSTYDIVRGDCTGNKQDMSSYPAAESFCMFPSEQYADYQVYVAADAQTISLRYAALSDADVAIWIDEEPLAITSLLATGAMDAWATSEIPTAINAGYHTLRIEMQEGVINLNWFKLN